MRNATHVRTYIYICVIRYIRMEGILNIPFYILFLVSLSHKYANATNTDKDANKIRIYSSMVS